MKEPLEKRIEFLWKQHDYISDFIKFADAKAGFIATVAIAVLGAMYSAHSGFSVTTPAHNHEIVNSRIMAAVSITFFVGSILTAAWSIKPRQVTGKTTGQISWVDIANYESAEDFDRAHSEQGAQSLASGLSVQVYKMATICKRKHHLVAWSLIFALIGAISLFVDFMLS